MLFQRSLLLFILVIIHVTLSGQTVSLEDYSDRMMEINRTGMYILGSWAVSNIAIGTAGYFRGSGSNKYFHQMNLFWNTVNLGIASFSLLSAQDQSTSLVDILNRQLILEKAFLFNTALDVAYVTGGFYLIERSKNITKNMARLKGYGQSVILQGAFLFSFDLVMYLLHHRHYNLNLVPYLSPEKGLITGLTLHINF